MAALLDFETLQRPASPNTHLRAPAGLCRVSQPDAEPPVFAVEPDALFQIILDLVEARSDWRLADADPQSRQAAFVAVTKLLGFKDDVCVQALPAPGGSTYAAYSASRIGYSDFGANAKRIEAFQAALEQRARGD